MKWSRIILIVLAVLLAGFLLLQVVPYGRAHDNPPVVQEPNWDSPQTRELAQRACFDCHSNETTWPWYSNIAPVSWLVQRDVDEGREILNFSDWGRSQGQAAGEVGEVVFEGEMPPGQFLILHPEAKLTDSEKQALASGLVTTARQSPYTALRGGEGREGGERDDD